jgi:Na+/proline symporter
MDTLQISLFTFIGLYFLLMIAASIRPGKVQSQEYFSIANRQAGPVPIISSLAASFRDGSGIVIWIGSGLTIGYGADSWRFCRNAYLYLVWPQGKTQID